jgi:SAM-dependent methyltransferase
VNYLEQYYDARVSGLNERDFLEQVGHTEGGLAISEQQFGQMVTQLITLLDPRPNDRLLDLCCGNGIITQVIGSNVEQAVGVDLSENMVAIARKHHSEPHISYYKHDVLKLDGFAGFTQLGFSKFLMHGGLQHFNPDDFERLLVTILNLAAEEFTLLFSFVPENGNQKYFYHSIKRQLQALYYRILKRDVFGYWWDKNLISNICNRYELHCSFHQVDTSLDASKYRFNIKISRGASIDEISR